MTPSRRTVLSLAGATGLSRSRSARAQVFPVKPVRIIVPMPPGGATEQVARLIAMRLQEVWGQPVVIETRPGAGSIVGTTVAARAAPDGHTILFTSNDHVFGPSLRANLPYHPIRDFAPITTVGLTPLVFIVTLGLPARTMPELLALIRAHPGQYQFASSGIGSSIHLSMELLKSMAELDILHIPYQGAGPAFPDLFAGRVQMMFATTVSAPPHIEAGLVRALAVSTENRLPQMPDLPTVAESGVSGYQSSLWYGFIAPAGVPPDILDKLNVDIVQVLEAPGLKQELTQKGVSVETSTQDAFGRFMMSELDRWGAIIRAAGVRLD